MARLRQRPLPSKDWFANDIIGIALGASLLLIENHRPGKSWQWFMRTLKSGQR